MWEEEDSWGREQYCESTGELKVRRGETLEEREEGLVCEWQDGGEEGEFDGRACWAEERP